MSDPFYSENAGQAVRYWRCVVSGCVYGFVIRNQHPTCHGAPMEPAPDHEEMLRRRRGGAA